MISGTGSLRELFLSQAYHAPYAASHSSSEWQAGSAAGQRSNTFSERYACNVILVEAL